MLEGEAIVQEDAGECASVLDEGQRSVSSLPHSCMRSCLDTVYS